MARQLHFNRIKNIKDGGEKLLLMKCLKKKGVKKILLDF